jgi:hypothetical protein
VVWKARVKDWRASGQSMTVEQWSLGNYRNKERDNVDGSDPVQADGDTVCCVQQVGLDIRVASPLRVLLLLLLLGHAGFPQCAVFTRCLRVL